MKRLARTSTGEPLLGIDDQFVHLAAADPALETIEDALVRLPDNLPYPDEVSASTMSGETIDFAAPLERSPQLWGIGLNYDNHAADLDETPPDEPASFLQPPGVLRGPGGPIRLPPVEVTNNPTAEAELGVIIGQRCRDLTVDEAASAIAGFVPIIDVTAEDLVRKNPRLLTRSKSFDSFLVLGASIACPTQPQRDQVDDWVIRTIHNEDIFAEDQVGNAEFSPEEIVASLSQSTSLDPGTVIGTGTPGAVPITPEDSVGAEIDPIGTVSATVTR